MLSLLIVVRSVISATPTCFFLKPSFQSACMGYQMGFNANSCVLSTFATFA